MQVLRMEFSNGLWDWLEKSTDHVHCWVFIVHLDLYWCCTKDLRNKTTKQRLTCTRNDCITCMIFLASESTFGLLRLERSTKNQYQSSTIQDPIIVSPTQNNDATLWLLRKDQKIPSASVKDFYICQSFLTIKFGWSLCLAWWSGTEIFK